MALVQHPDALASWTALLETVTQLVDWVHFTATLDFFNQVVTPRVASVLDALSLIRTPETGDIRTELEQLLHDDFSWNGAAFVRQVSAVDLLAALKGFKVVTETTLGKGAYARVMLARNQMTGESIVHKRVALDSPEHGLPIHMLRELALLKTMHHPHVVKLYDVLYRQTEVVLVLEVMDLNLRELMKQLGGLPPLHVKSFTHQILQGLAYAKSKRCMHRDLKPANILVAPRQGLVKIGDFGLGRCHDLGGGRYTKSVMTLRYRAPEIMLGLQHYDAAVDMWSVGCMLAEMSTGETTFTGESEIDQLLRIFQLLGRPCPEDWPEAQSGVNWLDTFPRIPRPPDLKKLAPSLDSCGLDLLTAMLQYNPAKRITAEEALQHPWFDDVVLPNVHDDF